MIDVMVPALNIEEILDTRPWELGPSTPDQIETLQEGLDFLELVQRGQDLARPVGELGVVGSDLPSRRAFKLLSEAGRASNFPIDVDPDLIEESISILRDLIDNWMLPNDAETERKINLTRELFLSLVNFGIVLLV